MKKEAGSSFDLWGIFLQTYLHSSKNKVLEQKHRIVIHRMVTILSLWLESIIVPDISYY